MSLSKLQLAQCKKRKRVRPKKVTKFSDGGDTGIKVSSRLSAALRCIEDTKLAHQTLAGYGAQA